MEYPLVANPACGLRYQGKEWMFRSRTCINGLAHGSGLAASLDGTSIIPDGAFILGRYQAGRIIALPPARLTADLGAPQ